MVAIGPMIQCSSFAGQNEKSGAVTVLHLLQELRLVAQARDLPDDLVCLGFCDIHGLARGVVLIADFHIFDTPGAVVRRRLCYFSCRLLKIAAIEGNHLLPGQSQLAA